MHRIQGETGETGVPSLIMIDETAPMLKHPMFRDYFIIGLQEGRKTSGVPLRFPAAEYY